MGSQQYCLKWNNHQSNMLTVFDQLLETESFVDVTIACEGVSFKAHKMVLSACSPYFQKLFVENPCQHPIVILKDIRYDDMKAIIDFMYKGEVHVSQEQLTVLLKTAESLKVKGLTEVTSNCVSQHSEPEVTSNPEQILVAAAAALKPDSLDSTVSSVPRRKRKAGSSQGFSSKRLPTTSLSEKSSVPPPPLPHSLTALANSAAAAANGDQQESKEEQKGVNMTLKYETCIEENVSVDLTDEEFVTTDVTDTVVEDIETEQMDFVSPEIKIDTVRGQNTYNFGAGDSYSSPGSAGSAGGGGGFGGGGGGGGGPGPSTSSASTWECSVSQKGKQVLTYLGYDYIFLRSINGVHSWRCRQSRSVKCHSLMKIKDGRLVNQPTDHCHDPCPRKLKTTTRRRRRKLPSSTKRSGQVLKDEVLILI